LEALTVQGRLDLGDEAYTVCSQPVPRGGCHFGLSTT
jgi:hypothetical protein